MCVKCPIATYCHERGVCGYVAIPTNNKTNEITYAKYQSRVLLTKIKEKMKIEEDGLLPAERHLASLHACLQKPKGRHFDRDLNASCEEWHKQGVLVATSEKSALSIFKLCKLLDPCPCKELVETKGVMLSQKKKNVSLIDQEGDYLQTFWRNQHIIGEVVSFAKVFLKGERFRAQDRVIVCYNEHLPNGKGLCEIKKFFSHENCGNIGVFFIGDFANSGAEINGLPENEVTGMKVVSYSQLKNTCTKILPISYIVHKCFLLPIGGGGDHVVYEMQDTEVRKRLLQPGFPGCIPPWLEIGDVILINLNDNLSNFQHAVVRGVSIESRKVRLGIMRQLTENEWMVETWRDWKICLKLLQGWIPTVIDTNHEADRQYHRAIRFRHINV